MADRSASRVAVLLAVLAATAVAAPGAPGCATQPDGSEELLPAVGEPEILWDDWGVPHVYAENEEDLFFAYGWAQARAHADLILRLYGEARGRAAEYWGRDHLDADRWVHTVGIPRGGEAWLEAQDPTFRTLLEAFADGVNAYARTHPEAVADDVEGVLPVDAADILAHGQRVVLYTFVVDASVVEGARRYLEAIAARRGDPSSPRTPNAGAGRLAGVRPGPSPAAAPRSPELRGSNAWAVSPLRSASGHSLLLANPHLPWAGRFTWFEAHLTAPGVDVYGTTLVGFPMIAIGFNERLGWTHTVNTHDGADLYELELVEGGYRFGDEVRPFETEEVLLRVAGDGGSVEEETLTVRRSAHGPVIAATEDRAVALRVVGTDAAGAARQWWTMAKAGSFGAFRDAVASLQIPMFTTMYADADGHVMHLFGGRVPVRPRGDWSTWSGFVSGSDPVLLWDRIHPYEELPRLLDPATGWLQNANEPPWTTTLPIVLSPDDYPAYMAPPPSMHFRAQRSARMLQEDDEISFDEMISYKHSTRVESADHLLDDVVAAAREYGDELAVNAAGVLEAWNRTTDFGGRGAILWATFFDLWRQRVGDGNAYVRAWSREAPLETPDGLADPRIAAGALSDAAARVIEAHGDLAVAWGDVHRLVAPGTDLPANGGPGELGIFRVVGYRPTEDGRRRAVGGDSFVAAVEFSDPVRARALLAYGNASQPGSPHLGDQLELFSRKALRPVWRDRADVLDHLELRETPLGDDE